jgi:hypothetical protein
MPCTIRWLGLRNASLAIPRAQKRRCPEVRFRTFRQKPFSSSSVVSSNGLPVCGVIARACLRRKLKLGRSGTHRQTTAGPAPAGRRFPDE